MHKAKKYLISLALISAVCLLFITSCGLPNPEQMLKTKVEGGYIAQNTLSPATGAPATAPSVLLSAATPSPLSALPPALVASDTPIGRTQTPASIPPAQTTKMLEEYEHHDSRPIGPAPEHCSFAAQSKFVSQCEQGSNIGKEFCAYKVKEGDTLSKLAEVNYGGKYLAYHAIVYYTNQERLKDTKIGNAADGIKVGELIVLPPDKLVTEYLAGRTLKLKDEFESRAGAILDIVGSSTLYDLTWRVADCFVADTKSQSAVKTYSTGTMRGLAEFCTNPEMDILAASVRITKGEWSDKGCKNVQEPIEIPVAMDTVTIVASGNNGFLPNSDVVTVTVDQLTSLLFSAVNWSEIPGLGWPAEPVKRYYASADSGTYLFLNGLLSGDLLKAPNIQNDNLDRENDQQLIDGIVADPLGIGFFGASYYDENRSRLKLMLLGQGKAPDFNRIEDIDIPGGYPSQFFRPLYFYTTPEKIDRNPNIVAFIKYYLLKMNYITYLKFYPLRMDETKPYNFQASVDIYCQRIDPDGCVK